MQLATKLALVVEGDAHSLAVISTLLRDVGINFKRNMTGTNVLEQLQSMNPPPDFILLNLDLPDGDGFTIGKTILKDRQFHTIPILLIGSQNWRDVIVKGQRNGFMGYLSKPLPKKQFPSIIERILAGEQVWEYGE